VKKVLEEGLQVYYLHLNYDTSMSLSLSLSLTHTQESMITMNLCGREHLGKVPNQYA